VALITCKACKAQISKKAEKCPNCGEPVKKKTSLITWLVALLVILWAAGFFPKREMQPPTPTVSTNNQSQKQDTKESGKDKYNRQPLPSDFNYKILSDNSNDALEKNQLSIEISEKLSIEQIATLADKIFSTKKKQRRFYISYSLPIKANEAWAISHFDPELKIEIFGSTNEEKEKQIKASKDITGKILGKWYDERQYASSSFFLSKNKDGFFIRMVFKDGQFSDEKVTRVKVNNGEKYIPKNGERNGEYFIVNKAGDLELYNSDGKNFTTASKIQ